MISLTWSYNPSARLIGCGVDCEGVDRFRRLLAYEGHPLPFVFTTREIAHAHADTDPATVLCLCFTAKEALFKAAGTPYNFTDCEVFPSIDTETSMFNGKIHLSEALEQSWGACAATVRSTRSEIDENEIISAVALFSEVAA